MSSSSMLLGSRPAESLGRGETRSGWYLTLPEPEDGGGLLGGGLRGGGWLSGARGVVDDEGALLS